MRKNRLESIILNKNHNIRHAQLLLLLLLAIPFIVNILIPIISPKEAFLSAIMCPVITLIVGIPIFVQLSKTDD